jgi:hypothetical protein
MKQAEPKTPASYELRGTHGFRLFGFKDDLGQHRGSTTGEVCITTINVDLMRSHLE